MLHSHKNAIHSGFNTSSEWIFSLYICTWLTCHHPKGKSGPNFWNYTTGRHLEVLLSFPALSFCRATSEWKAASMWHNTCLASPSRPHLHLPSTSPPSCARFTVNRVSTRPSDSLPGKLNSLSQVLHRLTAAASRPIACDLTDSPALRSTNQAFLVSQGRFSPGIG